MRTIHISALAKKLGVHVETIKRRVKAGRFPEPIDGGDGSWWRFRVSDVENRYKPRQTVTR